ncbi:MAG: RICIN domain-containing protein [Nannocystis sp.]|uniref:RICIN domain-containing protein n=1 Tax=Nannocystis sp. TaxID=1962667 RepID=UPI0024284C87|nr:RICIN domain-containing protein [Nannocystis sp.]MBK9754635.1 RICIN domain-containing protein [Nannocystis sp.]
MSWYEPSSWDDPFVDLYDKGKSVIDKAADAAKDAIGVAQILGDGIVDAAETVGDGLVTAGEGVAKWSVTAAGDTVDWSKTSFAEVAEWTERAAGDVASFTVEAYKDASNALEVGAKWVWEQLASYFYETLPKLGGLDPKAREVAAYLLSDPVARGIESLCATAGCVITFGIKLKAVSSINIGLYACGGGWGFFVDSRFDSLQEIISSPSLSVGVSAQVTMVFGPVSRASGARAVKLGLGLKTNPKAKLAVSVGGVILMEATMPPMFLGVRYAMDLDLDIFGKKKTADEAGKLKWKVKVQAPKPNGDFVTDAIGVVGPVAELGWEELTNGLSAQAPHFDAALRARADPADAERIQATALAAAMAAYRPRYYGSVRTLKGQTVIGTSQGALGLDLAGDRKTVQLVAGLTDPTGVSFEAVGEPPLYWCADANGTMKLVPYDKQLDLRGTTFRMVRGLAGSGASFAVASDGKDNPRCLVATRVRGGIVTPTPVFCAERLLGTEAPTKEDATFLLDRPSDQPEVAGPLLRPGQFLRVGESKRSANGMFSLVLADNGRLAMRQRTSGPLGSPTAWLVYQPGLIQDQKLPWAWASPQPAAAAGYHAIVTQDGRIAVRAGAGPEQAGATLWQSDVVGAPGPCFMAITNQGVVTLVRGTPESPGEIVWSSVTGAIYWPTRRRQVVLRADRGFVSANNGGGVNPPEALTLPPAEPVLADAKLVSGWEAFELQELCDGHVALRAQGRRFIGVQDGGIALTCLRDEVGPRELFTREVLGDVNMQPQVIRLRSVATGGYVRVGKLPLPDFIKLPALLAADADSGGAAVFQVIDVEHDFTAHTGRLVHLVAKHSGKALEVPGGRLDDGLGVTQGRFYAGDHQKWILTHVGGGWFTLTNRHTGRNVDIYYAQVAPGAIALQWPAHAGDNQRFSLTPLGDGSYSITAKHSGLPLEVGQASQESSAPVVQMSPGVGANQRWTISLASSAMKAPDAFEPVLITDLDQLVKFEAIRLKSWKGDYLRRLDAGAGVTSSPTGDTWRLTRNGATIWLRSSKGDCLHRPNSPQGVTTFSMGIGNEWTLELRGSKVLLRSWKGDYLHRPDSPSGVTTWSATIGSEWTVEALIP